MVGSLAVLRRLLLALLAGLLAGSCGADAPSASPGDAVVEVADGVEVALRRPGGAGPHPVVVYVPGGGWTEIDERDVGEAFGLDAAFEDGWAVATVRYRVADPDAGIGAADQAGDVAAAVRWAGDAADEGLGGSVLAVGHSAGAHLLALAVARDDRVRPDAVLLASGVYDFRTDVRRSELLADGLRDALWCTPTSCEGTGVLAPATWLDGSEPPITLVHGTRDRVTPAAGAVRFADALREAGVPVEVRLAQGGRHRGEWLDRAVAGALAGLRAQAATARSSR